MWSAVLVALASFGCGGVKKSEPKDVNYEVRKRITAALKEDRELDSGARGMLEVIKAGQFDLQAGLDGLAKQSEKILDLITRVSAPAPPTDKNLAAAQSATEEYLRNRVYQLEASLAANTPAELDALYNGSSASLSAERQRILEFLLRYDPSLEKSLP